VHVAGLGVRACLKSTAERCPAGSAPGKDCQVTGSATPALAHLLMTMLSPACVPQARRASALRSERETSTSHPHPLIRCHAAALAA